MWHSHLEPQVIPLELAAVSRALLQETVLVPPPVPRTSERPGERPIRRPSIAKPDSGTPWSSGDSSQEEPEGQEGPARRALRRVAFIHRVEIVCGRCGLRDHEADAAYCRRCGTAISTISAPGASSRTGLESGRPLKRGVSETAWETSKIYRPKFTQSKIARRAPIRIPYWQCIHGDYF